MRASLHAMLVMATGCAAALPLQVTGLDGHHYVIEGAAQGGAGGRLLTSFRPEVCDGYNLRPDYGSLNEASLVRFLSDQHLDAQVQRQPVQNSNPELNYVFVSVPGVVQPVGLRVATLPNADEAGRALTDALGQRGRGSWGLHRANLAVLGPSGSAADDIAVAATTKLACWGTFTMNDGKDAIVLPGGYTEP
jgi:hypothetical protein